MKITMPFEAPVLIDPERDNVVDKEIILLRDPVQDNEAATQNYLLDMTNANRPTFDVENVPAAMIPTLKGADIIQEGESLIVKTDVKDGVYLRVRRNAKGVITDADNDLSSTDVIDGLDMYGSVRSKLSDYRFTLAGENEYMISHIKDTPTRIVDWGISDTISLTDSKGNSDIKATLVFDDFQDRRDFLSLDVMTVADLASDLLRWRTELPLGSEFSMFMGSSIEGKAHAQKMLGLSPQHGGLETPTLLLNGAEINTNVSRRLVYYYAKKTVDGSTVRVPDRTTHDDYVSKVTGVEVVSLVSNSGSPAPKPFYDSTGSKFLDSSSEVKSYIRDVKTIDFLLMQDGKPSNEDPASILIKDQDGLNLTDFLNISVARVGEGVFRVSYHSNDPVRVPIFVHVANKFIVLEGPTLTVTVPDFSKSTFSPSEVSQEYGGRLTVDFKCLLAGKPYEKNNVDAYEFLDERGVDLIDRIKNDGGEAFISLKGDVISIDILKLPITQFQINVTVKQYGSKLSSGIYHGFSLLGKNFTVDTGEYRIDRSEVLTIPFTNTDSGGNFQRVYAEDFNLLDDKGRHLHPSLLHVTTAMSKDGKSQNLVFTGVAYEKFKVVLEFKDSGIKVDGPTIEVRELTLQEGINGTRFLSGPITVPVGGDHNYLELLNVIDPGFKSSGMTSLISVINDDGSANGIVSLKRHNSIENLDKYIVTGVREGSGIFKVTFKKGSEEVIITGPTVEVVSKKTWGEKLFEGSKFTHTNPIVGELGEVSVVQLETRMNGELTSLPLKDVSLYLAGNNVNLQPVVVPKAVGLGLIEFSLTPQDLGKGVIEARIEHSNGEYTVIGSSLDYTKRTPNSLLAGSKFMEDSFTTEANSSYMVTLNTYVDGELTLLPIQNHAFKLKDGEPLPKGVSVTIERGNGSNSIVFRCDGEVYSGLEIVCHITVAEGVFVTTPINATFTIPEYSFEWDEYPKHFRYGVSQSLGLTVSNKLGVINPAIATISLKSVEQNPAGFGEPEEFRLTHDVKDGSKLMYHFKTAEIGDSSDSFTNEITLIVNGFDYTLPLKEFKVYPDQEWGELVLGETRFLNSNPTIATVGKEEAAVLDIYLHGKHVLGNDDMVKFVIEKGSTFREPRLGVVHHKTIGSFVGLTSDFGGDSYINAIVTIEGVEVFVKGPQFVFEYGEDHSMNVFRNNGYWSSGGVLNLWAMETGAQMEPLDHYFFDYPNDIPGFDVSNPQLRTVDDKAPSQDLQNKVDTTSQGYSLSLVSYVPLEARDHVIIGYLPDVQEWLITEPLTITYNWDIPHMFNHPGFEKVPKVVLGTSLEALYVTLKWGEPHSPIDTFINFKLVDGSPIPSELNIEGIDFVENGINLKITSTGDEPKDYWIIGEFEYPEGLYTSDPHLIETVYPDPQDVYDIRFREKELFAKVEEELESDIITEKKI